VFRSCQKSVHVRGCIGHSVSFLTEGFFSAPPYTQPGVRPPVGCLLLLIHYFRIYLLFLDPQFGDGHSFLPRNSLNIVIHRSEKRKCYNVLISVVPTKLYGSEFPVRSVYFLWKQGSKDSALALAPSERNCAITDVQFAFMKGSLIFECFALYEL
jgi:hypothetical protein